MFQKPSDEEEEEGEGEGKGEGWRRWIEELKEDLPFFYRKWSNVVGLMVKVSSAKSAQRRLIEIAILNCDIEDLEIGRCPNHRYSHNE